MPPIDRFIIKSATGFYYTLNEPITFACTPATPTANSRLTHRLKPALVACMR